ncbi:response regulator transcription factor [Burkholderia cenocepacia]|uniref:Response regulator transcription factor n=1 Tax=Burkholderia cenocepacia TaxID=95486 RepID=A0AAW4TEL5_9BURK|nr:response regulator transcription factor [Burkholderia cenocepacia]SDR54012.1 two component transcriptional regulator, LuxR family [Burkholderia orbicola]MBR7989947.1 response regulator transcription factor [Burkholderia cenocepacia]MBR8068310.1 response regulator transcription factor [Burkholderia cenocepacia]MBR8446043.1 response regulator transcription factor [Burkholderia cenocepacia]MBR8507513.1 response regulator transcription factor [Burkholderia cenocepacia]
MDEFSVRVIVADDHPVSGHGIAQALRDMPTIEIVAVVPSAATLIEQLDAAPCDVLVLDYVMPGDDFGDGQALIGLLRRRYPGLRFVTVTMLNTPAVFLALQSLGVNCIVSKSDAMSHLVAAVHAAFSNGRYLSPRITALLDNASRSTGNALSQRESEIVRLFREGYKVSEIAERLHRSKKTVSAQKLAAMRKLGLTRDADLIRYEGALGESSTAESASND